MFRYDSMCYEIAQEILNDEEQKRFLTSLEFNFLLISLSHQENVEVIFRACEEYKRHLATLTDSPLSHYWKSSMRDCQSHADIVQQFGRFPHRNSVLSRPPTDEETAFLTRNRSAYSFMNSVAKKK